MNPMRGPGHCLAVCLTAGLAAWMPSPARAEVVAVAVGVDTRCPYGLIP